MIGRQKNVLFGYKELTKLPLLYQEFSSSVLGERKGLKLCAI
uniref:Uncharacterized protein n=1 Tax=Tetranychus urticae TaxID=32264 RepID=T1KPQ5_TETUR